MGNSTDVVFYYRFAVIHGDGARPDVSFYTMID